VDWCPVFFPRISRKAGLFQFLGDFPYNIIDLAHKITGKIERTAKCLVILFFN